MDYDKQLKLQAFLDEELSESEAREVASWLAQDQEATLLLAEMRNTRQALLDAALLRIEAGESFDSLSLRSVARGAGIVPNAFYRHFASMDELGLTLVEESFRTLRAMLREAREGLPPEDIIRRSVEILMEHVRQNRLRFDVAGILNQFRQFARRQQLGVGEELYRFHSIP